MRVAVLALLLCASGVAAAAQTTAPKDNNRSGVACPPGSAQNAPTLGKKNEGSTLSDQLAESGGVICPPAGVDPQMRQAPSAGGSMKVVPPPGSPGGNPHVQPK